MLKWTRWDLAFLAVPLLLAAIILAERAVQHFWLDAKADEVFNNIASTANAVQALSKNAKVWFPAENRENPPTRVFNDPFSDLEPVYHGLDQDRLSTKSNHGLVLQLVRYEGQSDRQFSANLFDKPFRDGEPYLRVLTDYGAMAELEAVILARVQAKLPIGTHAAVDSHMTIVDLRRRLDAQ